MGKITPIALTIAGSDCSGGAGIQADLKAFAAHGVYGLSAVTCVVAEIPGRVLSIAQVDPAVLRDQLEVLLASYPIEAIKTGMLYTPEQIRLAAEAIGRYRRQRPWVPVIVDPVMVATSGDSLMEVEATVLLQRELIPLASLITPNLDEATALSGLSVDSEESLLSVAKHLAKEFGVNTLLKGGHLEGETVTDILIMDGAPTSYSAPRVLGVSTHGTGCTYSSAIAANMANGLAMPDAVATAKEFVTRAISRSHRWDGLEALRLERD